MTHSDRFDNNLWLTVPSIYADPQKSLEGFGGYYGDKPLQEAVRCAYPLVKSARDRLHKAKLDLPDLPRIRAAVIEDEHELPPQGIPDSAFHDQRSAAAYYMHLMTLLAEVFETSDPREALSLLAVAVDHFLSWPAATGKRSETNSENAQHDRKDVTTEEILEYLAKLGAKPGDKKDSWLIPAAEKFGIGEKTVLRRLEGTEFQPRSDR